MAADAPNSSSEDGLLDGVLHQQYTNTLESIADAVRHCAALVEAEGRTGSTTRDEMRKNLPALLESVEAQQAAAPTVEDLAAQEKASAAAEVTRYWSQASGGGGGASAGAESSTTRSTKADILSLRDRLTSSQTASKGADHLKLGCLKTLYRWLEEPHSNVGGRWIARFLSICVVVSVICFVIETSQDWMANRLAQQGVLLVEGFCVLVFTVEIVLRLVVCRSKLLFWVQPMTWIDLASIVPWYAELAVLQSGAIDDSSAVLSSLSILRILRLLRIFKIGRQSFIFQVVTAVIKQSRQALVLTSFVFLVATTLLATLLYLCESPLANPGVVTAVDFESVPAAAWFVLITLTTVGYGDVVPVTTAGKLIALCAVVFGIIVIAMPLAVVGTNFIVVYNIYVKATMAGGDGKDGKVGLLEKVSMIRRGSIAGSPVSFRRGSGASCSRGAASRAQAQAPRSSAGDA